MLCFSISEEQGIMKDTVAKFVQDVIHDKIHEMDEEGKIPEGFFQKYWELGTSLSSMPEEYGGYGLDSSPLMNCIILEELAYGDMAFAIGATLPSLFLNPILEMGTEEQKKKYIPQYCNELFLPCTLAISEPRFNFDPVELHTTATGKNGSFILNGKKCFVPLAKESGHIMVAASLDGEGQLFIVSSDNPGIKIGDREKNLGLNSLETYEIEFEDCVIPASDRIGGNSGCCYDKFLQKTRVAMSAIGTGVSRASFEYARDYAKEREQFGEPIGSRQSIAFMIAEMAYEVDSMRLLTWKAASLLEHDRDVAKESYLAKLYAGDMTMKIADFGVQVLGGHGYIRDHPVERYYRNGRGIAVLEGMAVV